MNAAALPAVGSANPIAQQTPQRLYLPWDPLEEFDYSADNAARPVNRPCPCPSLLVSNAGQQSGTHPAAYLCIPQVRS